MTASRPWEFGTRNGLDIGKSELHLIGLKGAEESGQSVQPSRARRGAEDRDPARLRRELRRLLRPAEGLEAAASRGRRSRQLHGARLLREMGLTAARWGRQFKVTTLSDEALTRPNDLVEREFSAPAPNRHWVADLTYVKTHSGWVYAALIIDVFSRMVVVWQISTSLCSALAIDVLEMAIHSRQHRDVSSLIHHSERSTMPQHPLHRAPLRRRDRRLRRQLR